MRPRAINLDGKPIDPADGVIPIMKEIDAGKLAIIGTGFYITRYGLFLTSEHVLSDLVHESKQKILTSYICHRVGDTEVHLRRVVSINLFKEADLAIGQADNFQKEFPNNPLMNMRGVLSTEIPEKGEKLITFAYPENKILDFTQHGNTPVISSDYYEGEFLRHVINSEHPYIPYPHFETSIKIRSGASGGPVFYRGRIIGVNCRGWDFGDTDDNHLSYVIPIEAGLLLKLGQLQVPEISWEYKQIPPNRRDTKLTVQELINYGHIDIYKNNVVAQSTIYRSE